MEALSALALLEASAQESKTKADRIGLFMPLVVDAVIALGNVSFTEKDVQKKMKSRMQIGLNQQLIQTLLRRCGRQGYLERSHGKYVRTDRPFPNTDFKDKRRAIEERHRRLVNDLMQYSVDKGYGTQSEQKTRRLLAAYLDANFKDISVRRFKDKGEADFKSEEYAWIHEFFSQAEGSNDEAIETASALVRGRIVYDAAFLPGFSEGRPRLTGLVAYLDSPLICRALGYGTAEEEAFALEAINSLRRAGIACRVLEQTIREMQRVLGAVYENWDRPKPGDSAMSYSYWMPMRGYDRGYVWRVSLDPGAEVSKRLGLTVVPNPGRVREYVSSERLLAHRLAKAGGPEDDPRVWHDVDCIAAVLTERKGYEANSIGDAKCFFVTTSGMTVRNTRRWWEQDEKRKDLAPIFFLSDLANYAWLYDTSATTEQYSKNAVMATCSVALAPSEAVWGKWIEKLEGYIETGEVTEEQARGLLYSSDAQSVISEMERHGKFDEGQADEAFGVALQVIQERMVSEWYSDVQQAASDEIGQLRAENSGLASENEALLQRQREADEAFSELARKQREDEDRLRLLAAHAGLAVAVFLVVLGVVLIAFSVHLIVASCSDGSFNQASLAGIVVSALFGIAGIAGGVFRTVRDWVARWVEGKLLSEKGRG